LFDLEVQYSKNVDIISFAESTNSTVAGTSRSGLNTLVSLSNRGSGTAVMPRFRFLPDEE
jgi:hypothetical protein